MFRIWIGDSGEVQRVFVVDVERVFLLIQCILCQRVGEKVVCVEVQDLIFRRIEFGYDYRFVFVVIIWLDNQVD